VVDTRIESPLFVDTNPAKGLGIDSPQLKKRQVEKQSGFNPFSSVPREKGESLELFPEIKHSLPLPDEADEVHFDTPSFRAPREKAQNITEWVLVETPKDAVEPKLLKTTQESKGSWLPQWISSGTATEKTPNPQETLKHKPTLPEPEWVIVETPKTKGEAEVAKGSWLSSWIPSWGTATAKDKPKSSTEKRLTDYLPSWLSTEKPLSKEVTENSKSPTVNPEPLIGYNRRTYAPYQRSPDELAHLPKHGGAILAKLVGMITDYQALSQSGQLEVFGSTSGTLEEVRKKQFELVLDQIRNRKDSETWSYRQDMLEYFGMATGALAGATMIGTGIATGGASLVPGMVTLAGSALSLGAKVAKKYYNENPYSSVASITGTLLSGAGMAKGMAALGSIPQILTTAGNATSKLSEFFVGQKGTQSRAHQFGLNAKNVKLQFKREENETAMRQLVGGLKASKESANLLGAATKALRTENEIKSRIALGDKA
jgi:hypothetical protein